MKPELLKQTIFENLQVVNEASARRPGTLGTVRGVFARVGVKNKNGRVYEDAVWDKVLKDPQITNMISTRKMVGESEHPKEPDTTIDRATHVVTSLKRVGDTIMGEAEILDTPRGLTVFKLFEAGVPVGISSRAYGDLENKGDHIRVIPESYELKTFDFTLNQSVDDAIPKLVSDKVAGLSSQFESMVKDRKGDLLLVEAVANELHMDKVVEDIKLVREASTAADISAQVAPQAPIVSEPSKEGIPADKVSVPSSEDAIKSEVANFMTHLDTVSGIKDNKVSKKDADDIASAWFAGRLAGSIATDINIDNLRSAISTAISALNLPNEETELDTAQSEQTMESIQKQLDQLNVKKELLESMTKELSSLKEAVAERDKKIAILDSTIESAAKKLVDMQKSIESANKVYEDKLAATNVSLLEARKIINEKTTEVQDLTKKLNEDSLVLHRAACLDSIKSFYPYLSRAKVILEGCKTKEAMDNAIQLIKESSSSQFDLEEINEMVDSLRGEKVNESVDKNTESHNQMVDVASRLV